MGLSEILETIRAESEQTASGLLADAEREAEEILARARAQAGSEERRLAGALGDRTLLETKRILSRAHLESARARRAAREDVYRRAIDEVTDRLASVRSSDRYEDLMGSLLHEAMAAMPRATTVKVDPDDAAVTSRVLAAKSLDIGIELVDTPLGGLVLAAPGQTVDNTLNTRLARADQHLRFVAGEILPELRGGETM